MNSCALSCRRVLIPDIRVLYSLPLASSIAQLRMRSGQDAQGVNRYLALGGSFTTAATHRTELRPAALDQIGRGMLH